MLDTSKTLFEIELHLFDDWIGQSKSITINDRHLGFLFS